MMLGLTGTVPSVRTEHGKTYGGSQMLSDKKLVSGSGCGLVCAVDTVLYISSAGTGETDVVPDGICCLDEIDRSAYNGFADRMMRFLPLIPHFGINAMFLTLGLNLFFVRSRAMLRARWNVRLKTVFSIIEHSMAQNLPVILAIGPQFPAFWGKSRLALYTKMDSCKYEKKTFTSGHYVTVTGIDDVWIRVSSWGREYYICRAEYRSYSKRVSCPLFSNVMYLKRK